MISSLLKSALSFAAGMYAGMYIAQNYEVPRVDEPTELWKKIKAYSDRYKKPEQSD